MSANADIQLQARDADLGHALSLRSSGLMEVLRITKRVRSKDGGIRFSGVPASGNSRVRGLEVSFVEESAAPQPTLDPVSGFIRLFYPRHEQQEVLQLLDSKRRRFCYFWHSRDVVFSHAWLLSSP